MPSVHVALRDLVTEHGERVLADGHELVAALEQVPAEVATTEQRQALVDAVHLGAFERMIELLQGGAESQAALETAADELVQQRGGDVATAEWALASLAYSVDLTRDDEVPAWTPASPVTPRPALAKEEPAPAQEPEPVHEEVHEDAPLPLSADPVRRPRRRSGCLPILLVILLFAAIVGWFARGAVSDVKDLFAGADDYPGPGSGKVTVVIDPGQSISSMGDELEELDVVASADAFVDAAGSNPAAQGIQAATYTMKLKMKASDAVAYLANPANAGAGDTVTVPEGARVRDIVATIVDKTDFTKRQLTRLLANPASIGLPAEAGGNPEGYLYPATYEITKSTTPKSLLSQMVAKTAAAEKDLGIAAAARKLGLTPHEVITVASILEYEANRGPDYPKVARVIYNRLDDGMRLQLDSTVSYVSKRKGDVWTTAEERASDSLYNTYQHEGLPPGPIGSPGQETIEAALHPANGPWLYFVPDYENSTTVFSTTLAEHNVAVDRLREYCRTHDEC
jgi:UPF0755 protein